MAKRSLGGRTVSVNNVIKPNRASLKKLKELNLGAASAPPPSITVTESEWPKGFHRYGLPSYFIIRLLVGVGFPVVVGGVDKMVPDKGSDITVLICYLISVLNIPFKCRRPTLTTETIAKAFKYFCTTRSTEVRVATWKSCSPPIGFTPNTHVCIFFIDNTICLCYLVFSIRIVRGVRFPVATRRLPLVPTKIIDIS